MNTNSEHEPGSGVTSGDTFWTSITSRYELTAPELTMLREIVRVIDLLDVLQHHVEQDGAVIEGPDGHPRMHPACGEARRARLALARLLANLRLPDDDTAARPQRRGGSRTPYRLSS